MDRFYVQGRPAAVKRGGKGAGRDEMHFSPKLENRAKLGCGRISAFGDNFSWWLQGRPPGLVSQGCRLLSMRSWASSISYKAPPYVGWGRSWCLPQGQGCARNEVMLGESLTVSGLRKCSINISYSAGWLICFLLNVPLNFKRVAFMEGRLRGNF